MHGNALRQKVNFAMIKTTKVWYELQGQVTMDTEYVANQDITENSATIEGNTYVASRFLILKHYQNILRY